MGSGQGTQKNQNNAGTLQPQVKERIRILSQQKFDINEDSQNSPEYKSGDINLNQKNLQKKSIYQPKPPYNYGDLQEKIQRLSFPKCTKGQGHKILEYVSVEKNCDPELKLTLLCKKCVLKAQKEGQTHQTQPLQQVLLSLFNQIQQNPTQTSSIDNQYNKMSNLLSSHIQQCKSLQKNIQNGYDNYLKSIVHNSQFSDATIIRKTLENIARDSSEMKMDYFFKKMKPYLTIKDDQVSMIKYEQIIEEQIDMSSQAYCQQIQRYLENMNIQIKEAVNEVVPIVFNNIEELREIEKQKMNSTIMRQSSKTKSIRKKSRKQNTDLQVKNSLLSQSNFEISSPQPVQQQYTYTSIDNKDKHNRTQTNSDLFSEQAYRPSTQTKNFSMTPQLQMSYNYQPSEISIQYHQQQQLLRSRKISKYDQPIEYSNSEKKYYSQERKSTNQDNLPLIANQQNISNIGSNLVNGVNFNYSNSQSTKNENLSQKQSTLKQQKLEEEKRLRNQEQEKLQQQKQEQKQKLITLRSGIVTEMENHVRNCNHQLCRNIEWGMETEYKFIGWKDENIINQDGRKKTTCQLGKELNQKMKELVRKLRLTQA